ncbi:MAG: hypothetical protein WC779_06055 [Candidatus Omnitrophota bacterium]
MRNVKMTALIGKSFNRTTEILFKPFSAKKWLKLLMIALLAGALAGGNGMGGGGDRSAQKQKDSVKAAGTGSVQSAEEGPVSQTASGPDGKTAPSKPPVMLIAIIAGAILGFLLFFIVLVTWLGSRFRFIWLNAVANNSTAITEPYYRHSHEANSLFKFSLILFFAYIIFIALDIGWALFNMHSAGAFAKDFAWSFPVGLKIFLLPAVSIVAVTGAIMILSVVIDNFIVPMMALDGIGIMAALKQFGAIFSANRGDIALFLLVLLGLGIVLGAGQTAVVFLALIAIVLIGLIVFGIPFVAIVLIIKSKIAFAIYAIVAAIPFIMAAVIALAATALPFAVFFRSFSLYYLISLNSGYTESSLAAYALKKAERVKGKAPIVLAITFLFIIGLVAIIGLLAAIAIPNFIKARENAIKKKAAVSAQASRNLDQHRKLMFNMGEFESAQ